MTDYEKLKSIIDEIDELIALRSPSSTPKFNAWESKARRFIAKKYGEESMEFKDFNFIYFSSGSYDYDDQVEDCKDGLETAKALLLTFIEDFEANSLEASPGNTTSNDSFARIFIVHGHDGELKQSVARIVEQQGLKAIILSEQANKGRTIIEKFEDYSDVGGAICLFTADDYGRAKADKTDNTRARQNVVLETGYFMGKLGRDHVVLLADKGIEMPSDLSGVVYTDTAKWEIDLLKELKAMGYTVDFNKLF